VCSASTRPRSIHGSPVCPASRTGGKSAFALDPRAIGPVDWLFSDVVCYPKRLPGLVQKWLAAAAVRRFVCTVKFQGATDFEAMRQLAAVPGSRLLHLHYNKHELTWIHPCAAFRMCA
jgi:23S rRNA (cytidine2498-2'-O)-methyltransferase